MMGALLDYFTVDKSLLRFTFQNTGEEHEKTYELLRNMEQCWETVLHWLEIRKPATYGAPPSQMQFVTVDFATANRVGKPFADLLELMAEYRDFEKSLPPTVPNPTMRLCTAYMKQKLQEKFAAYLCIDEWDTMMGLRADEPSRVGKMRARDTAKKYTRAPLAEAGLTKADVMRFWAEQPFDLDLPENLGNCKLCFLKDEADLAWNMLYELPYEDTARWIALQEKYGQFRKRGSIDYRGLLEEAPTRFEIRGELQRGETPVCSPHFSPKRHKLLIAQEKRILKEGLVRIPCSCEFADLMTDDYLVQIA